MRFLLTAACDYIGARPYKVVWRNNHSGKKHQLSSPCPVELTATYQDDVVAITSWRTDLPPFTKACSERGESRGPDWSKMPAPSKSALFVVSACFAACDRLCGACVTSFCFALRGPGTAFAKQNFLRVKTLRRLFLTPFFECFQGSSIKTGTIQRKLAWPPRKDDAIKSKSINNTFRKLFYSLAPLKKTSGLRVHGNLLRACSTAGARKSLENIFVR